MSGIHEEIKQVRLASGRSLRQQAIVGRVHHSTLSRWESGASTPSQTALSEYLAALDVPPDGLKRLQEALGSRQGAQDGLGRPSAGELLRAARHSAGILQADLAQQIGVTQGTISKWESGAKCPDEHHVPLLASALGVARNEMIEICTPGLVWCGFDIMDLADCVHSYSQHWQACAIYDRKDGELWNLAITQRLLELSRQDSDALRPLGWCYASAAYWMLVRGRYDDVQKQAKQAIRYGKQVGFDMTTAYAFWAVARVRLARPQNRQADIAMLQRLSKVAHSHLAGTNLPYAHFIDAAICTLQGDFDGGDEILQKVSPPSLAIHAEDQFSAVGEAYWMATIASYRQMFAVKARQWNHVFQPEGSVEKSVPLLNLLSECYRAGAEAHLSPLSGARALSALRKEASSQHLEFAFDSMIEHVRSLGLRLPSEV